MAKVDVSSEIKFKTARSGGSGGQNVNKVETMVEGRFFILNSTILTNEQKEYIVFKLGDKLIGENVLLVKSQEARTQIANKELVVKKINDIINKALIKPKIRKETKVPKSVIVKRKEDKKKNSLVKESRKKVKYE